ncbi:hypothetical protein CO613_01045 [Lysobacteraceae bacterium NML07-0707]|nr:hypothetical protein CO613_01045 [Xanthomonadaceae bacterium NML07-0707]
MSKTATAPKCAPADACTALFGRPPEDVLSSLQSASEALEWLRELCRIIAEEARALNAPGALRIVSLAEAASYLACEFCCLTNCDREDMAEHLEGLE